MTACVNNEKEIKGGVSHKVLRSVVAGVLAVSMVPTAAFAAPADGASADGQATTLNVVSPATDFSNGSVTAAVDGDGGTVDVSERPEWTVDSEAHYVVPTQVTTGEGTVVDLEQSKTWSKAIDLVQKGDEGNTFQATYYKDDGGTTEIPGTDAQGTQVSALSDMDAAGTYYAVVTGLAGDYAGAVVAFEFGIASKSLEGASLYVVDDDSNDVSNTDIVFKGSEYTAGVTGGLWIAVDGKPLGLGDATLSVYKAGSSSADAPLSAPEYAGDYVAVVTGADDYLGSKATIEFSIEPFDIASANFAIDDVKGIPASGTVSLATINGEPNADLASLLKLTPKESFIDKAGTYTMTVSIKDGASGDEKASITGTKDVSYNVLEAGATDLSASVYYGSATLQAAYRVDHSKGDADFDVSKIVVKNGDDELSADQFVVSVADADGSAATTADLSTPGVWKVTVKVDPAQCEYGLYGTATTTVTVVSGELNPASDVFVKYDGKVVGSIEATYDGTDLLEGLEVSVRTDDGERTLAEGADYEVEVVDNDTGKTVEQVVDVNDKGYTVKITSDSWMDDKGSPLEETVAMVVNPIEPTAIRVAGMKTLYGTDADGKVVATTGIPYTGEDIVPTYEYTVDDLSEVDYDDAEWTALPEGAYEAALSQGGKEIEAVNAVGSYLVDISNGDADENASAKNYNVEANERFFGGDAEAGSNIAVIDATAFADVAAAQWYAEPVTLAKALGYVNGVYGTKLFQPERTIWRADVVCILYNMAGGSSLAEGSSSEFVRYASSFSDVDTSSYYAEAIGWAVKTGVVNGYDDGTFAPERQITREEAAAMFANYAKASGKYAAVEDAEAALAGFPDGSEVSAWAVPEVAWAAENGVMGNGGVLNPLGQITRAEVAAMAVNYQPEALK